MSAFNDVESASGTFQRVASVADFKDGKTKKALVNGKPIAIFPVKGGFIATTAVCPHAGGPIDEGDVEDLVVTCPWHGLSYDLESGDCVDDPQFKLERYVLRVEGNDILIAV